MTETVAPPSRTPEQDPAPAPPARDGSGITVSLLVSLAVLSAAAPVATDLYLPSFPAMTSDLSTTTTGVQLTLTAFMVGAGLGQLVFGPLSDRLGRRGPLLLGLGLYVFAGLMAVSVPSVGWLVLARLLQGLGGAAGMVIARAVIADLAHGPAAARAMSLMMLVGGMAPVVAPVAGGLLAEPIGWRGIFGVITATGVVSLALTVAFVRETHPAEARAALRTSEGPSGLLSRAYLGYTLAFALGISTMFSYIAASPFVYQSMMGLSELQYGLAFGLNAVGLATAGALSARLVGRYAPRALVRTGLAVNLVAVVGITAVALSPVPAGWLAPLLFVAVASLGLVLGNATALALDAVPGRGGAASAWIGATQFILAGAVSALVGLGGEETAVPLALTMLVGSVGALAALRVAGRTPA